MRDKETTTERPWTPGPWRVDGGSNEIGISAVTLMDDGMLERRSTVLMLSGEHPCTGKMDWTMDNMHGDLPLFELAAEMAEAILMLAEEFQRYGERGGTYDAAISIAEKLRAKQNTPYP